MRNNSVWYKTKTQRKEKRNTSAWYETKAQHKDKSNNSGMKLKHNIKRRAITLVDIKLKQNVLVLYQSYSSSLYVVLSFIPNRVIPLLFTLCFSFIPVLFLFSLCCV
jgi:hypothetical protein